jgi:hypothetical protein
MNRGRWRALVVAAVVPVLCAAAVPGAAQAHGPIAPVATKYLARIDTVPPGLDAKVIDGDLRIWLRVPASQTVVILDYRGAPYLRFSAAGVAVNENSSMYYLNQTPAEVPPPNLGPDTPPKWSSASGGHSYQWHDGRLGSLATVALAPGRSYVGRWFIPVRVNGRLSSIAGGLWHAPNPSIVWFWLIVVIVVCTLAAWRVRSAALNARVARVLALSGLAATVVSATGQGLHGRPTVSVFQLITLAAVTAFVVWALRRVLLGRAGYFTYFVIAFVAIWEGAELIPTLLDGFVLAAVPAFVARAAAVVCLGSGVGLLLVAFRLVDKSGTDAPAEKEVDEYDDQDANAWESYA